jgi:hypothetical protein
MSFHSSESQKQHSKSRSRGISCDMTPEAILRRLDIVDELRELAMELQNAKRLGSIRFDQAERLPPVSDGAIAG